MDSHHAKDAGYLKLRRKEALKKSVVTSAESAAGTIFFKVDENEICKGLIWSHFIEGCMIKSATLFDTQSSKHNTTRPDATCLRLSTGLR